jgi:hypothetical protein
MPPRIAAIQTVQLKQTGASRYISLDGRFSVENTWSVARNREPNWHLVDRKTDRRYRFFVLSELGQKINELTGPVNTTETATISTIISTG